MVKSLVSAPEVKSTRLYPLSKVKLFKGQFGIVIETLLDYILINV